MDSFCEEDEDTRFFDACEDVSPVSTSNSESLEKSDCVSSIFQYDVWIQSPLSIQERRSKFLDWMDSSADSVGKEKKLDECAGVMEENVDGVRDGGMTVLRTPAFGDEFCSTSSMSCCSNNASELLENSCVKDNFTCRIGNLDDGRKYNVDELRKDCKLNQFQGVGVNPSATSEKFGNDSGSSPSVQGHVQREIEGTNILEGTTKQVKKGWLRRLRSLACIVDRQWEVDNLRHNNIDPILGAKVQRVKVRQSGKQLKELSALYLAQDIQAHKGAISTMKFSPDGQYLASAGEDGIVRVWQVVEDERSNELDIPDLDPSCMYFTVNHLSELAPFDDKEKMGKLKTLKRTSDSACVIFPPKVLRILEKPLHEFHGHIGEILDLSWSKNNLLLSASVDKSVRLWQVGCDHCLKVFSHNNYVTCVQFNPIDDNNFISGSLDGKVRIWAIPGCQVVDWTDVREIVTAVCYRPDGQGGVVGSMTGNCRFYHISDNHLQLDDQICLRSKKKSPCKRITGFQFLPQDPSKIMVSCADSRVRILHGSNVIGKYKGLRNAGNHTLASLTSDGKHIVSACEDSSVYVWNCVNQEEPVLSLVTNVKSCEHFSVNASVAVPWSGSKCGYSENEWKVHVLDGDSLDTPPLSSPAHFSLSKEFILESFPKGSATWPEEKLPTSSPLVMPPKMRKSQYKFLNTSCRSSSSSHAWGLVIVTAGWDGRIRSFHNYGLPVST